MALKSTVKAKKGYKRVIQKYKPGKPIPDLGPFTFLPGCWESKGRGWNMIALPFQTPPPPEGFNYRVLMNQYNERLKFELIDENVPNRGLPTPDAPNEDDQFIATLDYLQVIDQVVAKDFPVSGDAGAPGLPIHHEPGLFLNMKNLTTDGLNIARLGSIPHGNSILALGKSEVIKGAPTIPPMNGLPIGVNQDINSAYLAPYKHFVDPPFFGDVNPDQVPGFPGFSPLDMNEILRFANEGVTINKTTILEFDSTLEDAGIVNIPFIERQADAATMKSTFWIQELAEADANGRPKLRMQYSQVVVLDFFRPRRDGLPGPIRWPHISINTLDKISDDPSACDEGLE